MERTEWVDALRISTLKGLDEEKGAPASRLPSSQDILDRIYKNASNKICADCASVSECCAPNSRGRAMFEHILNAH